MALFGKLKKYVFFFLNNLAPQDKVFTALNYSLKINIYSHKLSHTHTDTQISYPPTSELSLLNDN